MSNDLFSTAEVLHFVLLALVKQAGIEASTTEFKFTDNEGHTAVVTLSQVLDAAGEVIQTRKLLNEQ